MVGNGSNFPFNAVVDKVTQQFTKIMQDVQDKADAEKFRKGETKMSGKVEKVNTKPKLEQQEEELDQLMKTKLEEDQ